ncbi:MAG TPA: metallophosphoesterase [Cyclobacteriaceae bacterium]|nr:metallophosphoesterase [Cyclobacteriaceae bacterium]
MMKKKTVLSLLLALFLFVRLSAQQTYQAPALERDGAWSLILVPDTQSYVKFGRNQPILDLMTAWIAEQIDPLNIKLVIQVGDLVEHNAILNPNGKIGDQPGKNQWEAVSRSFGKLDGKVPYIAATGNHDYGILNVENRKTEYNKYFPVDKNFLSQRMLKEVALDEEGMPTLTNAAYEFISPEGRKFLVLVLEFAPREANLQWGIKVVNDEKYKDHTVILVTHSYLDYQNNHIEKENYPITDGNYGKAVWEKLVKPSKNIQMVFSGHIGGPDDKDRHVGFRTDKNAAGKRVHQMTFNAQALGGGWHGNGGDGWLRILEFKGNSIQVRTFSPYFAISPSTRHLAWGTEEFAPFSIELDD